MPFMPSPSIAILVTVASCLLAGTATAQTGYSSNISTTPNHGNSTSAGSNSTLPGGTSSNGATYMNPILETLGADP